jgi:hypothetical protein
VVLSNRVVQDRRNISRISTRFSCHFTLEGVSREAVAIDLSLKGALLSSKIMPPIGAEITIILRPPGLKNGLRLEARVVRGGWGISDHGAIGKFGIRFRNTPPELMHLINKMK